MPDRDYYLNKGAKFDAYRAAYRDLRHAHLRADRRQDAGRVRGPGDRAREQDRRGRTGRPRRQRRRQGDQQPDGSRRPGEARPGGRLERRARPASASATCSTSSSTRRRRCRDGATLLDTRAARDVEEVPGLPPRQRPRPTCRRRSTRPTSISTRKALRGVEEQRDRWKRGIGAARRPDRRRRRRALRRASTSRPEHKAKMDALVANLRAAP